MGWNELRGHQAQREMLQRCIERDRLPHALLFAGPDGIGKKLFARLLAQSLFCPNRPQGTLDACGKCPGCRQVKAGSHPDLLEVGCPEGKSEFPIAVLIGEQDKRGREGLCHDLAMKPMMAARRVAIIDDASMLNPASGNALLKTLEEPPDYAVMILIANDEETLLPTIRSRCQMIRFAPLTVDDVEELLLEQKLVPDAAEAQRIAALSEGSLALAKQLVTPELRRLRELLFDGLASTQLQNVPLVEKLLQGLDELGGDSATQRIHAGWIIRFVVDFYRIALLQAAEQPNLPDLSQVARYLKLISPAEPDHLEKLIRMAERAEDAYLQIQQRSPAPLVLETLFEELGRLNRSLAKQVIS